MLSQAFLLGLVLVYPAQGDLFQNLDFFHNLESQFQSHVWDQLRFEKRSIAEDSLVKNRLLLSPEYKDPTPASSEDKPIVIEPTKENYDKSILNPKKENHGCKHPQSPIIFNTIDLDSKSDFLLNKSEAELIELFGFTSVNWWQGKNVCIEREESSVDEDLEPINCFTSSMSLSNCTETENTYECITKINIHGMVKTFMVRYKCCYGFQKTPQSKGCHTQVELKKPSLLQILDDLKLIEFKALVKSSGLQDTFTNGNYTLFVPSDDAISDYNNKINDLNKTEVTRRRSASTPLSDKEFVMSHVINGFYKIGDLQNEQKLQSEDNKKFIRINTYATQTKEKMLTANCATIKNGNILVENVVVYVLDKVINPTGDSIENIINNHPKLITFKRVMEKTDMSSYFKPDGHYTIFAPTDEAFKKLDEIQRQTLLSSRGCASSFLKHHTIAYTVCSSAIVGNDVITTNIVDSQLYIERELDDEFIFEPKAKIVDTDIIGSNGIIHLIDTPMIPLASQYTSSALKYYHFDKFLEIVDKAGLSDELNNFENATVFVPSNKAFDNLHTQEYLEQIGDDNEKLKELIRYHFIEGEIEPQYMINNMLLASKNAGKELRVNLYSSFLITAATKKTVNCAIYSSVIKTCGSIVYIINRVFVPPTKTLFDLINDDDRYMTLKQMVKGTEVEKILQDKTKSFTFLAPTDETFATLEETERKALLDSKEKAEQFLKAHILTEVLCCSSDLSDFKGHFSTLGNQSVEVNIDVSQFKVNSAVVTSCDNLATNGVLQIINKVLAP